ncbi:RNA ligase (ATP) [Candidatus Dojkabacteria bacterium]|jgi:RNA ligase (TIGR02306 family)|nr:RNA ligase (ATP) [Candidatus Dojkabacteria bacterium]
MRKLATIRKIDDIFSIPDADRIECAVVGGWKVVVKKGEYSVGQLVLYCEIDSWIPTEIAPFLTKPGRFSKDFNGVKGERLRTVKLRGQISQGLILPLNVIGNSFDVNGTSITVYFVDESRACYYVDESDLSELLGIQKWEAPVSVQMAGSVKGSFPTEIPKTDEERIQNLKKDLRKWVAQGDLTWEVTEKLDGSSTTFYLDLDDNFRVCSRNIELKEDLNNSFWKAARDIDIESKMRGFHLQGYAIQGELVGPGIQGNKYKLKSHLFFAYKIYNVKVGEYLNPLLRQLICVEMVIHHVPIIDDFIKLITSDIDNILLEAEGKSVLNSDVEREGKVYKCCEQDISWKAISNKFLLKGGD